MRNIILRIVSALIRAAEVRKRKNMADDKNRLLVLALFAVLVCIYLIPGCVCSGGTLGNPTPMSDTLPGYLLADERPDSLALLPTPPAAGSVSLALDEEVNRKSLALRGTPRWALAAEDAFLKFPEAADTFSCALNAPITERDTPHLYRLLLRTRSDVRHSTQKAKDYYKRQRPFVLNKEPSCSPDDENALAKNGSHPSGHTAICWAWALILSEIAPEQMDGILARGWAFGESRLVCNVHWQSDVAEGRVVGASAVAQLHADFTFREDLDAAKAELRTVRARGLNPLHDCTAEAAALAK